MSATQPGKLERRIRKLELAVGPSMRESVIDFYQRVPSGPKSKPRWTPDRYPTGSEKELYPEFAYILLAAPQSMLATLLDLFQTPAAKSARSKSLAGTWKAYRLSTRRRDLGIRWVGPMIFPGAAGHRGIADVGLFLNPSYDDAKCQMRAELILYFELKSRDRHVHDKDQLQAHLAALKEETDAGVGFLAAIGGRPVEIGDEEAAERWLGHVSLQNFLDTMARTAANLDRADLAAEIKQLQHRCSG